MRNARTMMEGSRASAEQALGAIDPLIDRQRRDGGAGGRQHPQPIGGAVRPARGRCQHHELPIGTRRVVTLPERLR
jgi:hypothetical protein